MFKQFDNVGRVRACPHTAFRDGESEIGGERRGRVLRLGRCCSGHGLGRGGTRGCRDGVCIFLFYIFHLTAHHLHSFKKTLHTLQTQTPQRLLRLFILSPACIPRITQFIPPNTTIKTRLTNILTIPSTPPLQNRGNSTPYTRRSTVLNILLYILKHGFRRPINMSTQIRRVSAWMEGKGVHGMVPVLGVETIAMVYVEDIGAFGAAVGGGFVIGCF